MKKEIYVDNSKAPTIVSFCTGYGGIERGLEIVLGGLNPIASCEIESYAIANLIAKMEEGKMVPHPVYTDVKTFPGEKFRGKVDILTGGYPCQPFSSAGKRKGTDDPRHLWPHFAKQIQSMRPLWCFFENVEGHIGLGLREVIMDLGELGYAASWGIFTAEEVGAPHRRERVFILAHSYDVGLQSRGDTREVQDQSGKARRTGCKLAQALEDKSSGASELAHSSLKGLERSAESASPDQKGWQEPSRQPAQCGHIWPSRPGEPQWPMEEPRVKPRLGGGSDGPTNRVDRLRLLGNGVVPQTAALAFAKLVQDFD